MRHILGMPNERLVFSSVLLGLMPRLVIVSLKERAVRLEVRTSSWGK
jgi:hypothetical protein